MAGTGAFGSAGDGGLATDAQLAQPRGLALDKDKNLYIADAGNALIRVVFANNGVIDASSTIDRFAGGGAPSGNNGDGLVATGANLSNPGGLAIAPVALNQQGNPTADSQALFIVDDNHNIIRKVRQLDPARPGLPAAISTAVASQGCTAAAGVRFISYSGVGALAFDKAGRLYMSGNISDFGGCPVQGGGSVGRLENNGSITAVAGGGSTIRASGPALGTQLSSPSGLAVDDAGNLYLSERSAHTLRRIDVLGRMTTSAGLNATAGFSGEYGDASAARLNALSGLAFGLQGDLVVLDEGNHTVRLIRRAGATAPDTATMTIAAGDPQTVTIGQQAPTPLRVHIVDAANNAIAGLVVQWSPLDIGDSVQQSSAITNTSGDASIAVRVGFATATLHRFQARVQTALEPVDVIGSPRVFNLTATRPAPNSVVAFLNSNGTSGNSALPLASTEFRGNLDFGGVALAADGTLLVSDTFDNRVLAVSTEGQVSLFAGTGVAGFADNTAATLAQLNQPRGLAVDDVGNVFIADSANSRVRVVDLLGNITTYAGNGNASPPNDGPATGAAIGNIRQILFNPVTRDLILFDFNNNEIRRIPPGAPSFGDESIFPVASAGNGNLGGCTTATGVIPFNVLTQGGAAVDAAGQILFDTQIIDFGGCPIGGSGEVVMKSTGTPPIASGFVLVAGAGAATSDATAAATSVSLSQVDGIAVARNGVDVFLTEAGRHRVRKVAGGTITTIAGQIGNAGFSSSCAGTACLFNVPVNLAVNPGNGDLYISENNTESVRLMITP